MQIFKIHPKKKYLTRYNVMCNKKSFTMSLVKWRLKQIVQLKLHAGTYLLHRMWRLSRPKACVRDRHSRTVLCTPSTDCKHRRKQTHEKQVKVYINHVKLWGHTVLPYLLQSQQIKEMKWFVLGVFSCDIRYSLHILRAKLWTTRHHHTEQQMFARFFRCGIHTLWPKTKGKPLLVFVKLSQQTGPKSQGSFVSGSHPCNAFE